MSKKLTTNSPCGLVHLQTMGDGPITAAAVDEASGTEVLSGALGPAVSVSFTDPTGYTTHSTGRVLVFATVTGNIPTVNLNQATATLFRDTIATVLATAAATTRGTGGAAGGFSLTVASFVQVAIGTHLHFGVQVDSNGDALSIPAGGINLIWVEL